MSIEVTSDLTGLERFFERAPKITTEAARLAINQVAERGGRKLLLQDINKQVAFPSGYVNGDRLSVRKAYNTNLEAVITARQRPTSLARFATGSVATAGNVRRGLSVMVHPGSRKSMPNAFLIRLRAGSTVSDTNFNMGVALRLKPGERIRNKTKQSAVQLGHNLYLLYGPSVDQVFRSVAEDDAPEIASMVADEFFRQFTRLSGD